MSKSQGFCGFAKRQGSAPVGHAVKFSDAAEPKTPFSWQAPGPSVRLQAPRGVSHVQLFSGIHRAVAADGTVEMTEANAAPLLRAGWVRIEAGGLPESQVAVS